MPGLQPVVAGDRAAGCLREAQKACLGCRNRLFLLVTQAFWVREMSVSLAPNGPFRGFMYDVWWTN